MNPRILAKLQKSVCTDPACNKIEESDNVVPITTSTVEPLNVAISSSVERFIGGSTVLTGVTVIAYT